MAWLTELVNLGKWILRYLFAGVIDEEVQRDEEFRRKLNEGVVKRRGRPNAPGSIALPENQFAQTTPGISLATPSRPTLASLATDGSHTPSSLTNRASTEKEDYFTGIAPVDGVKPAQTPAAETPTAPATEPKTPAAETGKDKDKGKEKDKADTSKSPSTPFGKKFKNPFGSKKLGRSTSTSAESKPVVEGKATAEESETSSNHEKEFEDSFSGVVQRVRKEYEKQVAEAPATLVETRLAPALPNDTPVLQLPPNTKVILKEETSGESSNIYIGTVQDVGKDTDVIEQRGAMWLGELLLLNGMPHKEPVKVSFVLLPWKNELPNLPTTDNNNRLNANRMLRVRKILVYVAERIDPEYSQENGAGGMKVEEYLELYCNDQVSFFFIAPGLAVFGEDSS
jgi:WD repeat-containing protein 48